ncbi:hypothetical protein SVAN01_05369 [Stagonosporopsis vannaccii]|nr:hypothetical protein SVAN01_05369 [Stagonosporopsis vannaccii]
MSTCLIILRTPATILRIQLVFGTERDGELTEFFSSSSDVTANGFYIQIARSIDAQAVNIPKSVIKVCPALKDLLVPGCRIMNADPDVCAIVIEHLLSSSSCGPGSFEAPGHLQELTLSDNPLLTFAKAWHIGDRLRMPDLQNAITKVYSTYYAECLNDSFSLTTPPGPIGPRIFAYLRDNIGNHTKAERFLIEVYASLAKNHAKLKRSEHRLIPTDIALLSRDRWKQRPLEAAPRETR